MALQYILCSALAIVASACSGDCLAQQAKEQLVLVQLHASTNRSLVTALASVAACDPLCDSCKAGGSSDGGVALENCGGSCYKCKQYCSTSGYCGTSAAYQSGTDCRPGHCLPWCKCNSAGRQPHGDGPSKEYCFLREDEQPEECKALNGNTVNVAWLRCETNGVTLVDCPPMTPVPTTAAPTTAAPTTAAPTTAAPTTAASAASAPNTFATGDPHLMNVRGERFDIYKTGQMEFLRVPYESAAGNANLTVLATIEDTSESVDKCKQAHYITALKFGGAWLEDKLVAVKLNRGKVVALVDGVEVTPAPEPRRISKMLQLHMPSGNQLHIGVGESWVDVSRDVQPAHFFLNVQARSLGSFGCKIGGLLGADDHEEVSTPPAECHTASLLARPRHFHVTADMAP